VYGTSEATAMPWFYTGTQACNLSARLYCFEQ